MKFTLRQLAQRVLPMAAATVLAACGGSDSDPVVTPASGTVRIALTDIPACGYDEVNVTVDRVRVHQNGAASDNASGWSEVVLSPPKRINLLNLTNGVLEELGATQLPVGTYTLLRLVLTNNTPTARSQIRFFPPEEPKQRLTHRVRNSLDSRSTPASPSAQINLPTSCSTSTPASRS